MWNKQPKSRLDTVQRITLSTKREEISESLGYPRRLKNLCIQFIILHYLGYSVGKYAPSFISYANGCYYHL